MRCFWAAIAVALALAVPAAATNPPLSDQRVLDEAASWMANQPVTVKCMASDEPKSPASIGAWAYVYLYDTVIYADDTVCKGALAIAHHDGSVKAWKRALGALVLTHEGRHLRLNDQARGNEAHVECGAIRHFRYMVLHLGGTERLSYTLLPWALTLHWKLVRESPVYYKADCQVPDPV